jgi:hypothetical protein
MGEGRVRVKLWRLILNWQRVLLHFNPSSALRAPSPTRGEGVFDLCNNAPLTKENRDAL